MLGAVHDGRVHNYQLIDPGCRLEEAIRRLGQTRRVARGRRREGATQLGLLRGSATEQCMDKGQPQDRHDEACSRQHCPQPFRVNHGIA